MSIMSYSKALGLAIAEEMRLDETIVCIGLDLQKLGGAFGVNRGHTEEFGEKRIVNMPIAEAGYTGLAVGSAATGLRPIVELQFGDWITIASDQLVNQAALLRYMSGGIFQVPMVMRFPCGAGGAVAAQHSHMFESWFAFIPGLKVMAPATPNDAKGMMKTAIRDNNPVIFFEHRMCYENKGEVTEDTEFLIPFGKADIKRSGKDVTIVTYSNMVNHAMKAAKALEAKGIDVEIVDLRSIRPMDTKTIIESVKKTGRVICLQETWLTCSVASEVAAIIADEAFTDLKKPIKRIGGLDCPVPFSPDLESYVLPNAYKIETAVIELLK